MSNENVKNLIGQVFNEIADAMESGSFGNRVKVGLTTLGSELGVEELVKAAEMASSKYGDFEVILIGPKVDTKLTVHEVDCEADAQKVMEQLLDSNEIQGCVTLQLPNWCFNSR